MAHVESIIMAYGVHYTGTLYESIIMARGESILLTAGGAVILTRDRSIMTRSESTILKRGESIRLTHFRIFPCQRSSPRCHSLSPPIDELIVMGSVRASFQAISDSAI